MAINWVWMALRQPNNREGVGLLWPDSVSAHDTDGTTIDTSRPCRLPSPAMHIRKNKRRSTPNPCSRLLAPAGPTLRCLDGGAESPRVLPVPPAVSEGSRTICFTSRAQDCQQTLGHRAPQQTPGHRAPQMSTSRVWPRSPLGIARRDRYNKARYETHTHTNASHRTILQPEHNRGGRLAPRINEAPSPKEGSADGEG